VAVFNLPQVEMVGQLFVSINRGRREKKSVGAQPNDGTLRLYAFVAFFEVDVVGYSLTLPELSEKSGEASKLSSKRGAAQSDMGRFVERID
jgi:hypothetical protein